MRSTPSFLAHMFLLAPQISSLIPQRIRSILYENNQKGLMRSLYGEAEQTRRQPLTISFNHSGLIAVSFDFDLLRSPSNWQGLPRIPRRTILGQPALDSTILCSVPLPRPASTGITVVLICDFFFFMATPSWRTEHAMIALELKYVWIIDEMHRRRNPIFLESRHLLRKFIVNICRERHFCQ